MNFELLCFIGVFVAIIFVFAIRPIFSVIKGVKVKSALPGVSYKTFTSEGKKVEGVLVESILHPSSMKHKWKERIYQIKVKYIDEDGYEKIIEPDYNHFYVEEVSWMKKQKSFEMYVYKNYCKIILPSMKYNKKTKGFDVEE